MLIALHNLATNYSNLLTSIRIAKETGYQGIEIGGPKLQRYLDQGFTLESLRPVLGDMPVVGLSYVQDIERQDAAQYKSLLAECEATCALAERLGCQQVQLLSGPLDPNGTYKGLVGRPWSEVRQLTAKNLRALADIGSSHRVKFYLEGLAFTQLSRLDRQIEVLEEYGRDNVGLVLDFYHLWAAGTLPDQIARTKVDHIYCVDFCDSLDPPGEVPEASQRGRDVWTGGGRIPLKQWVDAIKATGFNGIWRCELLSPKYWELDPWTTAKDLKSMLEYMLLK